MSATIPLRAHVRWEKPYEAEATNILYHLVYNPSHVLAWSGQTTVYTWFTASCHMLESAAIPILSSSAKYQLQGVSSGPLPQKQINYP